MAPRLSMLVAEAANHATACLSLRGRNLSHEWDAARSAWAEVETHGLPVTDDYVEEVRLLLEPGMHPPTRAEVRLVVRDLNTLVRCVEWAEMVTLASGPRRGVLHA